MGWKDWSNSKKGWVVGLIVGSLYSLINNLTDLYGFTNVGIVDQFEALSKFFVPIILIAFVLAMIVIITCKLLKVDFGEIFYPKKAKVILFLILSILSSSIFDRVIWLFPMNFWKTHLIWLSAYSAFIKTLSLPASWLGYLYGLGKLIRPMILGCISK